MMTVSAQQLLDLSRENRDLKAQVGLLKAQVRHDDHEIPIFETRDVVAAIKAIFEARWKMKFEEVEAQLVAWQETERDLREQIRTLEAEVQANNGMLVDRQRILDLLPCPAHGYCVPFVLDWITKRLVPVPVKHHG